MRSKRIKKYQTKNRSLLLASNVVLIFYLAIFTANYLTSNTSAYYSSQNQMNGTISSGTWETENPEEPKEDESLLTFLGKGNQNIKASCPTIIKDEIKNIGVGAMQEKAFYEVYYIENGNPEKHGEKINLNEGEGTLEALVSGGTAEISYEASESGVYVFLVHKGNGEQEDQMWSKWIKVECDSKKEPNSIEDEIDLKKVVEEKEENTSGESEVETNSNAAMKEKEDKSTEIEENHSTKEQQHEEDGTENVETKNDTTNTDPTSNVEEEEHEKAQSNEMDQ